MARAKGVKRIDESPTCYHEPEICTEVMREDGSGKVDLVCRCGWVVCEVMRPNAVNVDQGNGIAADVEQAEADLGISSEVCPKCEGAGYYIEDDPDKDGGEVLCGCEAGAAARAKAGGNLFDQVQAGFEAEGVSLDEATGEVVDPLTSAAEVVQEFKPDKVSRPFLRPLPVPVPEEDLATYAKELSRLHQLWLKTKVDAKRFAKACKEVTDKAEEDMTAIAEIIEAGTEEQQISVQWEYDYRGGVKWLRRLDTMEIVKEETLTADEMHLSFDFEGADDEPASTEAAEEIQEAPEETKEAEWVRNDERTKALLETAGVKVDLDILSLQSVEDLKAAEDWALAVTSAEVGITVPAPPAFFQAEVISSVFEGTEDSKDSEPVIDRNRRCCMPADRATFELDGAEVTFCKVCGLVHRKRGIDADPWDEDLTFEIGEKVDLEAIKSNGWDL